MYSWGGVDAWGREIGAFLPSLPGPIRASLYGGGGGLVNSRAGFHPANEFSGSEAGARGQPRCSISKPCKCCYLLFLALAPNIGVSFLPLPPLLFVLLGPWSVGPGGTVLTQHADVTLLPPLLLAGAEEQLPREEGGKMWRVCTSVLSLNCRLLATAS